MSTPKYLCATMAILALAGCGDDEGGGPAGASTPKSTFDGSGAEVEGYFAFRVTASTGIYADEFYGPVGLTGMLELSDNGDGTVNLYRPGLAGSNWASLTLDPDTATSTYQGSITYVTGAGGTYNGEDIDEVWTLNFNGSIANLTVTAGVDDDNDNGTAPIATGTMTIDLQVPWTYDDSQETTFYGKQTAFSSDARYIGQTGVIEIGDWGPGTYADYYWDGGYNWNDELYIEGFWKVGDYLVGGGYYNGSYGNWMDKFGTVTIALNTSGKPASSSGTIWDTATNTSGSVAHTGYKSDGQMDAFYNDDSYDHDLTVTTVTAGGTLETLFGPAGTLNTDEFYSHGGHLHTSIFPGSVNPYKDGNTLAWVLWDEPYYDYYASTPYDMDGDTTNKERISVSLTVVNGFFTSGTATFQSYDGTTDVLETTETMTFTLNAAPVISSTLTASGTINVAITQYNITASHSIDSYSATGLPAGLTVDTGTGAITGTPTESGTFNVTIGATNPAGTGTAILVMTIAP